MPNKGGITPPGSFLPGGGASTPSTQEQISVSLEIEEAFLALNMLEARWESLKNIKKSLFIIGDLYFGTGTRFFKSAALWRSYAAQHNTTLHYIAYAGSAMTKSQLRSLSELPHSYQDLIQEFQQAYPPNQIGTHRIWLPTYRIALTLVLGGTEENLKASNFIADCWFLDFATPLPPTKFQSHNSSTIKALTSTFKSQTTYCGRGQNKPFFQQLQTLGFDRKTIQIQHDPEIISAGKCETNLAEDTSVTSSAAHRFPINRPWFNHTLTPRFKPEEINQTIVIGAGMAGAWTARTLAERGMNVIVVDKADDVASSASGNPVGVLYVKPGTEYTKATKLAMIACTNANSKMMMLNGSTDQFYDNCGVLQLLSTDTEIKYAQRLIKGSNFPSDIVKFITREEASALANTRVESPALYFPKCGRVFPKRLCTKLLQHPNIQLILGFEARDLVKEAADDLWHLNSTDKRKLSAHVVVVAAAIDTLRLKQTSHLPLKAIRGQITISECDSANDLKMVLCGDGYVAKTADNKLCFGASFILSKTNIEIREAETLDNLKKLSELSPALHNEVAQQSAIKIGNRVSVRATSPDYLPLVGPVADNDRIKKDFFHLTKDSNYRFSSLGSYYEGLYVNVGHGSKGLTTSPIAAEIISDYIYNAPFSIDINIVEALHPTRFTIRALIKNRIKKE